MREITVETTGKFALYDRFSHREIPSVGSAKVPYTPFIEERLGTKELRETDPEPAETSVEVVEEAPKPKGRRSK